MPFDAGPAAHQDTKNLVPYQNASTPNIEGGMQVFINKELNKISNSIIDIVAVMRLLEARMNTNNLV